MPARASADRHDPAASLARGMALARRYAPAPPAYAVYPTTRALHGGIGAEQQALALQHSNIEARPLSLYVHVPFCQRTCFHCARRPITTTDTRLAEPYLARLDREMVLVSRHLDPAREIRALHWGGGTPTFLTLKQMSDLIDRLEARFRLATDRDREYLVEIDPREADMLTLRHLEALGFNRLSLGVLDLDGRVQRAINRIQPRGLTEQLIDEAGRLGFHSLNLDLIIGLPCQTRDSFAATLEQVIAMAPPRLSLFHYAHHPERFAAQRQIHAEALPGPEETLAILHTALEMLDAAGYMHVGRDRFVRDDDRLARVKQSGRHRPRHDLLGFGVSAITRLEALHVRNATTLADYEAALDAGRLPAVAGHRLSLDDRLRSVAIEALMSELAVDLDALSEAFEVDAEARLAVPLSRLLNAEQDGLIERHGQRLIVTPTGRLLVRQLAMAFDAYLPGREGEIGNAAR